jgi:hypothetical protein
MRLRWEFRVLCAFTVLLFVLSAEACGRTEDYVIESGTPEGWVFVEFGNPKCPPVSPLSKAEFHIPADGYVCTSTTLDDKWVYQRFWLSDGSTTWRRLAIGDRVHQRSTVKLDAGTCHATAFAFWYGTKNRIDDNAATALRNRKPGCS